MKDLVSNLFADNIEKLQSGFNEAMVSKVSARLNTFKEQIASNYFGQKTEKVNVSEDNLMETPTRKHFQQVADLIKSHENQDKRNELATHHAEIFAKQNPRFDKAKFHAAAGSTVKH